MARGSGVILRENFKKGDLNMAYANQYIAKEKAIIRLESGVLYPLHFVCP